MVDQIYPNCPDKYNALMCKSLLEALTTTLKTIQCSSKRHNLKVFQAENLFMSMYGIHTVIQRFPQTLGNEMEYRLAVALGLYRLRYNRTFTAQIRALQSISRAEETNKATVERLSCKDMTFCMLCW
ncbi:hypothetical protein XENOCAPTIV_018935 [Xenoophorus captivus]|uniref:Uncharacterized protein n=1 Tax=Xenoophorus captivus TaxID=1517983 RepID=A0ABV0RX15_9TELE